MIVIWFMIVTTVFEKYKELFILYSLSWIIDDDMILYSYQILIAYQSFLLLYIYIYIYKLEISIILKHFQRIVRFQNQKLLE